jgi:hypothetical protein
MNRSVHLITWVTAEVKSRFTAVARSQGWTESAPLRAKNSCFGRFAISMLCELVLTVPVSMRNVRFGEAHR